MNRLKRGKYRLTKDECKLLEGMFEGAYRDIASIEEGLLAMRRSGVAREAGQREPERTTAYQALSSAATTPRVKDAVQRTAERINSSLEETVALMGAGSEADKAMDFVRGVLAELSMAYKGWSTNASAWATDWEKRLSKGGRPKGPMAIAPVEGKRQPGRPRTSNTEGALRMRRRRAELKSLLIKGG